MLDITLELLPVWTVSVNGSVLFAVRSVMVTVAPTASIW